MMNKKSPQDSGSFEKSLDSVMSGLDLPPATRKQCERILRVAHTAALEQAKTEARREILKWIQKYPNGTMTMDGQEIEFHAVPTNQVVKKLLALEEPKE